MIVQCGAHDLLQGIKHFVCTTSSVFSTSMTIASATACQRKRCEIAPSRRTENS